MSITADVFEVRFRARNQMGPGVAGATRELKKVQTPMAKLEGLQKNLASVGTPLLGMLKGIGAAAGVAAAGFGALAVAGARAASEYEVLVKTLEIVTRSADRARAVVDFAEALAAPSPFFDTVPLARAAAQLEALSLQTERYLPLAATMATVFGQNEESLMTFVSALGRLRAGSAEGFERLRESFGITRPMLEAEGLQFNRGGQFLGTPEQALAAVERIVRTRYAGMDAAMQATFTARFRSMIDAAQRALRRFGEPILAVLAPAIDAMTQVFSRLAASGIFQRGLTEFARLMEPDRIIKLASHAVSVVMALIGQIPHIIENLGNIARLIIGWIQHQITRLLDSLEKAPWPIGRTVRRSREAFREAGETQPFHGAAALSAFFTGGAGKLLMDWPKFLRDSAANLAELRKETTPLTAPGMLAMPGPVGAPAPAEYTKTQVVLEQIEKNTRREVELTQTLLGGGELARIGASSAELWAARRAGSRHAADLRGAFARLVVGRA